MSPLLIGSEKCDRRVPAAVDLTEVPAGEFWMGCEAGRADENPVHRVWVDAFAMGATTVTNLQYRLLAEATGVPMPPASVGLLQQLSQPVVAVTWFDARAIAGLSGRRLSFRLPTEVSGRGCPTDEKIIVRLGRRSAGRFELYRTGWQEQGPHQAALHPPNGLGAV
jgi:hypothetical protein